MWAVRVISASSRAAGPLGVLVFPLSSQLARRRGGVAPECSPVKLPSSRKVKRRTVAWFVLVSSGLMEAVWARALGKIRGLSRPLPIIVFLTALTISLGGLAYAMRTIPTGSAYAVWVGMGAGLTAAWGTLTGQESADIRRTALIGLMIVSVVGLMVVD